MAQVIDYYHAIAGGSSTMYYYSAPDNYSTATRIHSGTVINLVADYGASMVGNFYRLQAPSGWIHWYHVQDVSPVYKTVLDACTPPTALSMSLENKALTIIGGGGGDLNAFVGFGVSWRERAITGAVWSEWSAEAVAPNRNIGVTANSGKVRQYRARTLGEAGSAYYSDYVVCEVLVTGNTPAGIPIILLPRNGLTTCADVAAFSIHCPAEPDGDTMTLQRSLNGGSWDYVASLPAEGGRVVDTQWLSATYATVKYRLMDANGAVGAENAVSIQSVRVAWPRRIAAGQVIANQSVSFAHELRHLLQAVNTLRAFYGQSELVLPGTVGRFGDVQRQLEAMQQAVDGCRIATGREPYGFTALTGFPTAQHIGQLQLAITQT